MLLKSVTQLVEAGVDEVGRGCLAGPVVAAAVILPYDFYDERIKDSKKLSPKQRIELEGVIKSNAITYAIVEVSSKEIDQTNILKATFKAMNLAISKLKFTPQHLAIDGNRFQTQLSIPFTCCVKGDNRYLHIAAASILAKTHRDRLMEKLHDEFPEYDWINNKGYLTAKHKSAMLNHGLTPYHRKTFWHPTIFDDITN